MSRPANYPAFGQSVFAMVEGSLRELRGADGVIGNQVVIDRGDGVFALVAHLKQGSTTVRVGGRVRAGDVIGACGNSGNSTEPHVHAQLMDRARAGSARGLPMNFDGITLPANEEHLGA